MEPCGEDAEDETEPEPRFTLNLGLWGDYLGSNGSIFYDGPVGQPSLVVNLFHCLSLKIWASQGLDNGASWGGFDDEIDGIVRCERQFGLWGVQVSGARFYITTLPADVFQFASTVSRPFQIRGQEVVLNAAVEYYTATSGDAPHPGFIVRLGGEYLLDLKWVGIRFGLETFHDDGAFGFEPGFLAGASVGLEWDTPSGTFSAPQVRCASGITAGDRGLECTTGVSFSTGL